MRTYPRSIYEYDRLNAIKVESKQRRFVAHEMSARPLRSVDDDAVANVHEIVWHITYDSSNVIDTA